MDSDILWILMFFIFFAICLPIGILSAGVKRNDVRFIAAIAFIYFVAPFVCLVFNFNERCILYAVVLSLASVALFSFPMGFLHHVGRTEKVNDGTVKEHVVTTCCYLVYPLLAWIVAAIFGSNNDSYIFFIYAACATFCSAVVIVYDLCTHQTLRYYSSSLATSP